MALARAVPEGQGRVFVIDGLAHVNLHPKARDVPSLLEMVEMLLEQRDKGAVIPRREGGREQEAEGRERR